jgi:hypothetical protein
MKRPPLAPEASESTGYEKVVSESSEGRSSARRAFLASLSGGRRSVAGP